MKVPILLETLANIFLFPQIQASEAILSFRVYVIYSSFGDTREEKTTKDIKTFYFSYQSVEPKQQENSRQNT